MQHFDKYFGVTKKNTRSAASLNPEWVLVFLCGQLKETLALNPQLYFFF